MRTRLRGFAEKSAAAQWKLTVPWWPTVWSVIKKVFQLKLGRPWSKDIPDPLSARPCLAPIRATSAIHCCPAFPTKRSGPGCVWCYVNGWIQIRRRGSPGMTENWPVLQSNQLSLCAWMVTVLATSSGFYYVLIWAFWSAFCGKNDEVFTKIWKFPH